MNQATAQKPATCYYPSTTKHVISQYTNSSTSLADFGKYNPIPGEE
jgi:hypothetical protein